MVLAHLGGGAEGVVPQLVIAAKIKTKNMDVSLFRVERGIYKPFSID